MFMIFCSAVGDFMSENKLTWLQIYNKKTLLAPETCRKLLCQSVRPYCDAAVNMWQQV